MHQVAAIVLAAGRSSRMGAHKLLIEFGGVPLIRYSVQAATASQADPVIVVLGHNEEAVRSVLPACRQIYVTNKEFSSGMATSLQAGILAVPESASAAIILLGDQPLVSADLIDAILGASAIHPDRIVATGYGSRMGTPVLFPRALFAELLATTGDVGGRDVIQRHVDELVVIPAPSAVMAVDVDTREDVEHLRRIWEGRMS